LRLCARLEGTGLHREPRCGAAISTNTDIFTLDLTNPTAKPVKVSTALGGDFNPAYSPDGKYLAWRSQARAGYESDKFRLVIYDRAAKTIKDLLPTFEKWVDEFAWGRIPKKYFLRLEPLVLSRFTKFLIIFQ